MKRNVLLRPLLAGITAAICSVQATAAPDNGPTSPMDITYDRNARETPPMALGGTCPIHVVSPQDDRQNKETIGAGFGGALLTGEAGRWVSDGLSQLAEFGFAVDHVKAGDVVGDGLTVETSLTRAYTWPIGIKLFSMVALKVQFLDKSGAVVQEKHYRAHGDKTNMWGADSEFVTTLNYGLNNLLPAMAQDLVSLCKGGMVAPYTYSGPSLVTKK
ncbi:hypothetical protein [Variovorax sp. YR216]|uniref:hypothetical protein n=1 Tax=Variovorax sp. YR216 TaxID=1882828 RepID=UPI00089A4F34|nr:hypothetical protein [Variovorax sp. YR216]SEA53830.1 hypothetical protein SAMN05444680_102818 [Variovorax sp. YR216]